ncbi:MAG TPA: methionine adenosyltransferase [Nanoarchaeota archaeon]|nr:methionine adenosyltransferase [Nanoarchaeota archaeon]
MADRVVISSESVGKGHPDKLCDFVSDSILDACLSQDPESRVGCETMAKGNFIVVAGEITTKAKVDYEKTVRKAVKDIGYTDEKWGINGNNCEVLVKLTTQSPDIAQGVDSDATKEQGAGDQGIMWGYATNETKEFMPVSIVLAHKLVEKLDECRKTALPYLRPDCKSQVAVEYENGKPAGIVNVVVAASHNPDVDMEKLRADVKEKVIKPICGKWLKPGTEYFINGTGRFELCGPYADAGLTGRKIIVDTYGGVGRHGGGAFSGKDPSKVDRSAAYMARYIAKNIVAAGIASECEVQLGYCIGIAEPTSVRVNAHGLTAEKERRVEAAVRKVFPLKPAAIIKHFDLKHPKGWSYSQTAAFGHFGRDIFPWEKTDKAEELKKAVA